MYCHGSIDLLYFPPHWCNWLALKPKLFLLGFLQSFAYKIICWPKIFNFKQVDGHKEFFKIWKIYSKLSKSYTEKYQKIKIKKKSSSIWCDSILKKL